MFSSHYALATSGAVTLDGTFLQRLQARSDARRKALQRKRLRDRPQSKVIHKVPPRARPPKAD